MQLAMAHDFAIHAYCFMPDHVHVLLEGITDQAFLPRFVSYWKQRTSYGVGRSRRIQLWQPGYFERVLRDQESSRVTARYIVENPVRALLTGRVGEFPFAWCVWMKDPTLWDREPVL